MALFASVFNFIILGGLSAYLYYYNIVPPKNSVVKKRMQKAYDFIVVGGGSAGSVVASRLSEDPTIRVLLLEAGGGEPFQSEIPRACHKLRLSSVDWKYTTEPQSQACFGLVNNQSRWAQGKVLGGSSTINCMIYTRGNRRDYDRWASWGNNGWSWTKVLPYFLKSEDDTNPWTTYDVEYHQTKNSTEPRLTVSQVPFKTPLLTAFLRAAQEHGYPIRDVNGPHQMGAMPVTATIRNGVRCSSAKAFLKPAIRRKNLHILMNSLVLKILFRIDLLSLANKAYGVQFIRFGKKFVAKASKEVIISAGAVNTPQLLMLSGVGPRSHLKKHNISVVTHMPGVGQNLQDHIAVGGLVWTLDSPVSKNYANLVTFIEWLTTGQGSMTSTGGVEGIAFVKTRHANHTDDWPDIQLHYISSSLIEGSDKHLRSANGFTDKTWEKYYKPLLKNDTFHIVPVLLRPASRGEIRLHSKDPFEQPIINPKYFIKETDLNTIVEGMKIAVSLGNAASFSQLGAKFTTAISPGCENIEWASTDYWRCLARYQSLTLHHPVGTAKMGKLMDPNAVVDSQLRLYSVKGVRVIDASVMPSIVSGDTNAPVIMIAEKGTDLIKKYWKLK